MIYEREDICQPWLIIGCHAMDNGCYGYAHELGWQWLGSMGCLYPGFSRCPSRTFHKYQEWQSLKCPERIHVVEGTNSPAELI